MKNDALLLSNDDNEFCIVTYDNEHEAWTNISLSRETKQFTLYGENHPDGDPLPVAMDEALMEELSHVNKILYVNLDSESGEPTEEAWLPFSVEE